MYIYMYICIRILLEITTNYCIILRTGCGQYVDLQLKPRISVTNANAEACARAVRFQREFSAKIMLHTSERYS